jgi:hypothetical protein
MAENAAALAFWRRVGFEPRVELEMGSRGLSDR